MPRTTSHLVRASDPERGDAYQRFADRQEEESLGMAKIGLIASFYQENINHLKSPPSIFTRQCMDV